ncbi:tetratricopeptide repeat protein [Maioricimonas rarisocia]|nr:tetratricopeptide repeat protein [Maioricimonas rarisocia]
MSTPERLGPRDSTDQLLTGRQPTRQTAIPLSDSDEPGSERIDDDRPSNINLRLLIISVVLAVAAVVGVRTLHQVQMRRMAHRYYELYEDAWEKGELRTGVGYLRRYVELAPHETEAQFELVNAQAEAALDSNSSGLLFRAFLDAEETLRESPELDDLRSKVVDLSIRMGRLRDAIFHLKQLNARNPHNADRQLLLARCFEADGRMLEASSALRRVIELDPRRFNVYSRLARILHDHLDNRAAADSLLNELVSSNRRSPDALLVRARFRLGNGETDAALSDIQRAWQLAPTSRDVLVLAADVVAARTGTTNEAAGSLDFDQLRQRIDAALKETPDDVELLEAAARAEFMAGRLDVARARLEHAREHHPEKAHLIWMLADIHILEDNLDTARQLLKQLEEMNASSGLQTFLQARMAMNAREWLRARTLLDSIRIASIEQPMVRSQIELARARCYAELGQVLQQEQSYRKSIDHFSGTVEHVLGLADALRAQGRLEDAITELRRASAHPDIKLQLARLLFVRNLQLTSVLRKWDEIETLLNAVDAAKTDPAGVLLLRASVLAARDQHESARKLIEEEIARGGEDVRLWIGLSQLEQAAGNQDEALAVLETARQRLGDSPDLTRARIRYWSRRPPPEDGDPLKQIAAEVPKTVDLEVRHELLVQLASAWRARGDLDEAHRLLRQAAETRPDALQTWEALFDLAMLRGRNADARDCLEEIRRIEGPDGIQTKLCTARLYMLQARYGETERLSLARELLLDAAELLPGSARIRTLLAEVDEHLGRPDAAIEHYRAAIDMGETDPRVVRRLVDLLYARGRVVDAEVVVERMLERPLLQDSDFGRVAAIVSLHSARTVRAIELARKAVPEGSTNYADHLWLGQVYWAAAELDEAESSFRRALELARDQVQPWLGLASFLSGTGRSDEAAQLTDQIPEHLPPLDAAVATAQCFEMAGQIEAARTQYLEMLELKPDDAANCWLVASFLLRQDEVEEARKLLQRVIDLGEPPTVVIAARRAMAVLLAAQGTPTAHETAVEMIDRNLEVARSADDLRVKTRLLALRPSRSNHEEIVKILTELEREQSLTDEDTVRLARSYFAIGDSQRGEELMRVTIAGRRTSTDLLAGCLDLAFDNVPTSGDIQSWMDTLTSLEPKSFRTRELQIRQFAFLGQDDLAVQQISRILGDTPPSEQIETSLRTADALTRLIQNLENNGRSITADRLALEAEQLYRDVASAAPEHLLDLARYLSFRWRPAEALAVCQQAAESSPPEELAAAYVEIILMHGVESSTAAKIQKWFAEELERQPDAAILHLHFASFAQLIREYDLAIEHYRRTIELEPQTAAAYNELAVLLLLHERDADEALPAVRTAIEIQGSHPALLDTEAMVLIEMEQFEEASRLLERAIAEQPSPVYYFHLAQAVLPASRTSARHALQTGIRLGLQPAALHPLERNAFQQLASEFTGE